MKEFFVLEKIYRGYGIPVHVYDKEGNLVFVKGYTDKNTDPIENDKELYFYFLQLWQENQKPIVEYEDEIRYGALQDLNGNFIILGPTVTSETTKLEIKKYGIRHHITQGTAEIYVCGLLELLNLISIITCIFRQECYEEDEIICLHTGGENTIIQEPDYEDYTVKISEDHIERMNYAYEKMWCEAIRRGEAEKLPPSPKYEELLRGDIGILAKKSIKQIEYVTVCGIVMATRSAIEGGVNPFEAYALSDLYLQALERCTKSDEMLSIQKRVEQDFAQRVRQQNAKKDSFDYIEKCKDYITQHINNKIVIQEIADAIPINCSYLSRRFSEQEGMTIQEYINRQKVKRAANMLKFSEYEISAISEYLGFSSQSNMSRLFKKVYGISPKEYRRKNKIKDFISKT